MSEDPLRLAHNEGDSRYEARLGGEIVAFADYRMTGAGIEFPHTVVDQRMNGRGIGSELVRFALDDVRDRGVGPVIARCWFVAGWIERHPEYADLLKEKDDPRDGIRDAPG